jgi:hypothetical protein
MLLCILAALLGGYYVFYVSQQTSYLITRNFRLLATIGEHIEAAIRSDRTVLSNMRFGAESLPAVKAEASKFIPFIGSAGIVISVAICIRSWQVMSAAKRRRTRVAAHNS